MNNKLCRLRECGSVVYRKYSYCRKHQRRYDLYGDPRFMRRGYNQVGCKVSRCKEKHKGLGYCNTHFRHLKLYGDPLHYERKRGPKQCNVKYCTRKHNAHGFCDMHNKQVQRGTFKGQLLKAKKG